MIQENYQIILARLLIGLFVRVIICNICKQAPSIDYGINPHSLRRYRVGGL